MPDSKVDIFLEQLWAYYDAHGRRELPWRQPDDLGGFDPYKVLVSEVMLQQTQVSRVIPKYQMFLDMFPTVSTLASASLGDVLIAWQGLGYNRRAKFLWQAAQMVVNEHGGVFPESQNGLVALPGVGINTAGATAAYAYNQPVIFVETNVRTVYIHHFFHDQEGIHDKQIIKLLEDTVDYDNPREFYWALMDYGTYLKRAVGNASRKSKHHSVQSPFHGSKRQLRGLVLRELADGTKSHEILRAASHDARLDEVLAELQKEGMITSQDDIYQLA